MHPVSDIQSHEKTRVGVPIGMETSELGWARPITLDFRAADNKKVAGSGRLRRPTTQPAVNERSLVRRVLEWT